jgi:DNA polymerase III, chi subunit
MQVDFYQASRDPAEAVVALIARNTLKAGKRLLVVAQDAAQLDKVSDALWTARAFKGEEQFLANGRAGSGHDARQPILLSQGLEPANGAQFLALADGIWRESEGFERVFLVFGDATLAAARECWKALGGREGTVRNFWKQDGPGWIKAG